MQLLHCSDISGSDPETVTISVLEERASVKGTSERGDKKSYRSLHNVSDEARRAAVAPQDSRIMRSVSR